jgi:hypothetical protein
LLGMREGRKEGKVSNSCIIIRKERTKPGEAWFNTPVGEL